MLEYNQSVNVSWYKQALFGITRLPSIYIQRIKPSRLNLLYAIGKCKNSP